MLWIRTSKGFPHYRQTGLIPMLVFLAFVVARYVSVNERSGIFEAVRGEFLLGLAATVVATFRIVSHPPDISGSRNLVVSIVLLFIAMIVQLPFAADPVVAQRVFVDRVFKFAMLTYMMGSLINSPTNMRLFITAFMFSMFYITLESVEGLISGGLYWQNQGVMRLHGAVSMYGHPNSLGGVSMGVLPFAWFLFPVVKSRILKLGLVATASTALICVIYSGSRTAYVGLLACIFWAWIKSDKKPRFIVRGMIVCLVALPFIPDQYIERFESIGGHEKEGNSKETRIVILEDALTVFLENPQGVGVASFPAVRYKRFGRSQDTHNLYLEVLTNLGVQGFMVFCAFIWFLFSGFESVEREITLQMGRVAQAWRVSARPPSMSGYLSVHYQDLEYLRAVCRAATGFILIRLVLGLFGMDMYEIYWWFGAGLVVSVVSMRSSVGANTRRILQGLAECDATRDVKPANG